VREKVNLTLVFRQRPVNVSVGQIDPNAEQVRPEGAHAEAVDWR
jgi:hypothetical protein